MESGVRDGRWELVRTLVVPPVLEVETSTSVPSTMPPTTPRVGGRGLLFTEHEFRDKCPTLEREE